MSANYINVSSDTDIDTINAEMYRDVIEADGSTDIINANVNMHEVES